MRSSKLLVLLGATTLAAPGIALADDKEAPGWGMAIAARVIGEKCPGALQPAEITALSDFIAQEYARSVETSGQGVAWWADLRDKLEQSYVEKYADPANCTEEAHDQAEDMVEDVQEFQKSAAAR